MYVNTRIVRGDDNRTLYVGDEIEGTDALEQIALGNAEEIPEPEPEAPAPKKSSSGRGQAASAEEAS